MHVESFCGVRSCQNGARCRDGVKVLWCHSHLVLLAFEGFIPTCLNFLLTAFCCFLLRMVRKKEERCEGRPRGRCMVCKV